jgi:hypothetical protein
VCRTLPLVFELLGRWLAQDWLGNREEVVDVATAAAFCFPEGEGRASARAGSRMARTNC